MTKEELGNLVKQAQEKKAGAFEELHEYSRPLLMIMLYKRGLRYADAEDITQNTMIRIYQNIEKIKDADCYVAWIYRIAQRCQYQHMCKQGEWCEYQEYYEGVEIRNYMTPEGYINQTYKEEEVKAILMELNEDYRKVMELRYIKQLRMDEIAEICKIPQGTVKSRLYHAKTKIRKSKQIVVA